MGLGEIGGGPARGMVRVGVVEADDVFAALAAFTLDADEFLGIDVVAVVGGIGAGVAAAGGRGDDAACRRRRCDRAECRSIRGGKSLRRAGGGTS